MLMLSRSIVIVTLLILGLSCLHFAKCQDNNPPPQQPQQPLVPISAPAPQLRGETRCFELNVGFDTRNPNGVAKQVITINGQFPGPTLRANIGDRMRVRVVNNLNNGTHAMNTTVHWHGIEMKNQSWWDGPDFVTQCAIPYGESMEYDFLLHQTGTYWYHSHSSWQLVDGFWGFLIVENRTAGNVEPAQYQDDILIAIGDWYHRTGGDLTADYDGPPPRPSPAPVEALLNGRGNADCARVENNEIPSERFPCDREIANQVTLFNVERALTYRVRVLNPSASATFNFSIDGHALVGIEMDGVATVHSEPATHVLIWPAQRYSFLVTMNNPLRTTQDFYIRTQMVRPEGDWRLGIRPLAALRYSDFNNPPGIIPSNCLQPQAASFAARFPVARFASIGGGLQGRTSCNLPPDQDPALVEAQLAQAAATTARGFAPPPSCTTPTGAVDTKQITVSRECAPEYPAPYVIRPRNLLQEELRPLEYVCVDGQLDIAPDDYDIQVVLTAQARNTEPGPVARWHFSNVSYNPREEGSIFGPAIFSLYRSEPVPPSFVPQRVPFGARVQVVINNLNGVAHPYHFHGHTFWVMGNGTDGEGSYIESLDSRRLASPMEAIKRDTTHARPNSWTVVRFVSNNPGAWLLHCHIHWHFHHGLGAVFDEGGQELQCRIPIPEETRRVCRLSGIEPPLAAVETPGHPLFGSCSPESLPPQPLFPSFPRFVPRNNPTTPAIVQLPVEGVSQVQPGQRVVFQPHTPPPPPQLNYFPNPVGRGGAFLPGRFPRPLLHQHRRPTTYINFFK